MADLINDLTLDHTHIIAPTSLFVKHYLRVFVNYFLEPHIVIQMFIHIPANVFLGSNEPTTGQCHVELASVRIYETNTVTAIADIRMKVLRLRIGPILPIAQMEALFSVEVVGADMTEMAHLGLAAIHIDLDMISR